jgi:CubicO group peptidase (beta-lactamase class C family)
VVQTKTDKKMKFAQFILLAAYSLIGNLSVGAQTNHPELDKFLSKKMEKSERIGMQAAFISDGELTWAGSYGIKTFQTSDKVNDSTVFMIASTSKPVTALAMMKLYDQDKVNLDEDINSYLPFNEFMAEEVFTPLNMNNTYWFLSEIPHDNIATLHNMPYKETDFKGTQVHKRLFIRAVKATI